MLNSLLAVCLFYTARELSRTGLDFQFQSLAWWRSHRFWLSIPYTCDSAVWSGARTYPVGICASSSFSKICCWKKVHTSSGVGCSLLLYIFDTRVENGKQGKGGRALVNFAWRPRHALWVCVRRLLLLVYFDLLGLIESVVWMSFGSSASSLISCRSRLN